MSLILANEETLLPLVEAVARVGSKPSLQTVRRWCHDGVKGGKRLEYVRCGHELRTSVEAVKRFFVSLSGDQGVDDSAAVAAENAANKAAIKRRLEVHFGKGK
jgi:hypothetical protein